MFIDLTLKADTKAEMFAAMASAGFSDVAGIPHHKAADVLLLPEGMVTRTTGELVLVNGIETAVREPVPGYHANVRTQDPAMAAALAPVSITAPTPQYVWA